MTTPTIRASRPLPRHTQTRLQCLLDQGDQRFFADHPTETERVRLYFKAEAITGGGEPSRYITVRIAIDGGLVRRFQPQEGDAR